MSPSQHSFCMPREISLDNNCFYTCPPEKLAASSHHRTVLAPKSRLSSTSEKKNAKNWYPTPMMPTMKAFELLYSDSEDEDGKHSNKSSNCGQGIGGDSQANPVVIEDEDVLEDDAEEGVSGEASGCVGSLELGDRNGESNGDVPPPGEILHAYTNLVALDGDQTDNPAGTKEAERFNIMPVNREGDRKRASTGGELSPNTKKRKLDQLNQPNDVDYYSDASARDGTDDYQSLRLQKHRRPSTPLADLLLGSRLRHEKTADNSGGNAPDVNYDSMGTERLKLPVQAISHSVRGSTGAPLVDDYDDDGGNRINEEGKASDSNSNSNSNNDIDSDSDSSSYSYIDSESDNDKSENDINRRDKSVKSGTYVGTQRLPTSVHNAASSKRATWHDNQRYHHPRSTLSSAATRLRRKQPADLRGSDCHRAPKLLVTDSPDSEEATSNTASNADEIERPIQGFLRRKDDGSYAIEFVLDTLPSSPHSPVTSLVKQRSKASPRSGNRSKYTKEEDERLIRLKEEDGKTWKEIRRLFPGRSLGSLQVRYSTKLKSRVTVQSGDESGNSD